MFYRVIGTVFILSYPMISASFFRFDRQRYAQGKRGHIPAIPGFRNVYRWVQVSTAIVAVASLFCHHPLLLQLYVPVALLYVGPVVCIVATALFIWAKVCLGAQYSPCCDSLVANRLVDTGPYAYIRHPIYVANLMWLLGLFMATGSIWIAINVAIVALYYVTSARQEELVLAKELPAYGAYMTRTGAFLPRLYRRLSNAIAVTGQATLRKDGEIRPEPRDG